MLSLSLYARQIARESYIVFAEIENGIGAGNQRASSKKKTKRTKFSSRNYFTCILIVISTLLATEKLGGKMKTESAVNRSRAREFRT